MKRLLHIQASTMMAGCERDCQVFLGAARGVRSTVAVLSSDSGSAVETWASSGADVRLLPVATSRWSQYMALRRLVAELRPDGVIFWTNLRLGLLTSACWVGGARRIVTHVGNPVSAAARHDIAARVYQTLPGATKTTLIPITEHVANSLRAHPVFSALPMRIVHNAVDLDQFSFEPRPRRNERIVTGMLARLDPVKDHETLLKAWKLVLRVHPTATLELAGDGVLRSRLAGLAERLGIAHSVRFLGWVSDVPGLLRSWDLVVHSTTEQEGLGNAMVEALATGVPLVATDVGPVREVTDEGRMAVLAPARDPDGLARRVLETLGDEVYTRSRAAVARQWVEREFSPFTMVKGYLCALGLNRCNTFRLHASKQ